MASPANPSVSSYRDWVVDPGALPQKPPVAPPWLTGDPNGRAFLQGIGQSLDDVAQRAREAVLASFPLYAPDDALPIIGQEVGMPQGVLEPRAAYRARLARAWDLWQWAGTAYGMLLALYAVGYPNPIIQTQMGQLFSLSGSFNFNALSPATDLVIANLGAVHLGGSPVELWSDFALLIATPWPTWWGGSAPADGSADQKMAAGLVKAWKSAHARCVKLSVVAGPAWGVGGTTWGSFTWGSGTVTVWTPPVG